MAKPRVLLIGWDAADWKVIQPLLDAGQMPNLARLIAGGTCGNLATIYPVLSPMLWTSIATGKRAYKHGIHGFLEPLPDGSGVRPVSVLSRKTKALWNILNQNGYRSLVTGWWPSHPAEPINGVMVSNLFQRPVGRPGALLPLPPGAVHPASLAPSLSELRVDPMELQGEFIHLFVPDNNKIDQARDKRLHSLGKIIAETMSIHAVATELLATQPWDFAAIYYDAIDHFGHGFMRYHPPRLPSVSEQDFAIYQQVIANAYRYHDAMLGTLLGFADDETTVIVMSDHGFHPDHLRPGYIPAEPAGPAIEHRHFGILCAKGPRLRVNEKLYGAGLLDICPTILTLFGLPPAKDMDGKVLVNAFKQLPKVEPIESWDSVPGDAGMVPLDTRLDPVASAEAFEQLVELGYVAPPGPDAREAIDEATCELKYNLARSYRDGNRCGDAAGLAAELWTRWPREHRFGILLIDCLGPLQQLPRRRKAIEELGLRIERYQGEAKAELLRRKEQKDVEPQTEETVLDPQQRRASFQERQWRELAYGRPLLIEWFQVSQALLEKQPAEARRYLKKIAEAGVSSEAMNQHMAGALAELGDHAAARSLLEAALKYDPDNAIVHAQLAWIHFQARRFEESIASATESLSLLYFQPSLHALLGSSLMERQRFAEAEQALRLATAQNPRHLAAHELLGRLYREHLHRLADAFAHEGRAATLRHELAAQTRAAAGKPATKQPTPQLPKTEPSSQPITPQRHSQATADLPRQSHAAAGPPSSPITVVSGLPRSGTSMMMQLLVLAGREALTDNQRVADEDNPLGYLEFRKTLELAKDVSWLPQARGKVVKIVAQLLPCLPSNEHYNIIFMDRDLDEVIASQTAMLDRKSKRGAKLDPAQLRETYAVQLKRIHAHLARRREIRILVVNYTALLADPSAGVDALAQFLGDPFDRASASTAIRPQLHRQKKPILEP